MMWIKRLISGLLQRAAIWHACRKGGFRSASGEISPRARYGKGVLIGHGVITDDAVSVGDYTYINRNSSAECCDIGKYCSISESVRINPVEHNLSLITTHPVAGDNGHYGLQRRPVTIGNDVLISLNAVILSGVTVGDGAVIGAGAVVTRDVRPYEVVAGVPARHIRFRFSEEKIRRLEGLRWWDWPEDKVQKNMAFLRGETETVTEVSS